MADKQSNRRKFLQYLGLTAGATLLGSTVGAKEFDKEEIKKLNAPQQEFMLSYEKWMNEYIEVIRIQKTDIDNIIYHQQLAELSVKAESFQPILAEMMKDETFALIYSVSIKRMTNEI
ncbi:MAG: hypothetical protein ACOYMA_21365 [Bacteroidia bacterium]